MKLVFIFDSTYPYYTGGIETWIYNVCERMIKQHEITIFTVKNFRKDDRMGHFEKINPEIKIVPVKNLNHIKFIKPFVRSYIAVYNSNVTVHSMYRAINRMLDKTEKYYFIALGTVFAAKTARLLKKNFPNSKMIASCRSLHPEVLGQTYPGVGKIAKKMEKRNLSAMDAIWSNGEDTQVALKKKGFDSVVIKNGVDFDVYDKVTPFDYSTLGLDNKVKMVTIGTVQKIKGYYQIIEAIKILQEKYYEEVHLVGLGKGNLDKFNNYAKELKVEGRVHLLGEQRNVVSYAKSADLIVCTSGGSGYGMAILESMISQSPIVAWDSPVYRQLLKNDYSARLVKSWDAEALADGIHFVINNPEQVSKWGERAREKAGEFDWSEVVREIETACENI